MKHINGKCQRLAESRAPSDDDVLLVVVPDNDAILSLLVPREFIDQVDMFSKLIGISRADFVRFAVFELVHHHDGGSLKKLADGE